MKDSEVWGLVALIACIAVVLALVVVARLAAYDWDVSCLIASCVKVKP